MNDALRMRARMRGAAVFALASSVLLPATADAQNAPRKLGRGLAGMTTAFLEVPGNIVVESDRRGPAEGIPVGFAKGLGMIVARVLVGGYEFASAPFPAPAGYRPILQPEFPWGYFDRGTPSNPRRRSLDGGP